MVKCSVDTSSMRRLGSTHNACDVEDAWKSDEIDPAVVCNRRLPTGSACRVVK